MLSKRSGWRKTAAIFLVMSLVLGFSGYLVPETVSADQNPVTIKVNEEVIHTFTWEDLQNMKSDEDAWVGTYL